MKLVGYVGRREDTLEIVDTHLFKKGDTPNVKSIRDARIRGDYLFELDLGGRLGSNELVSEELLRRALSRALVTLVATGLTPEQKEALGKQVPNLRILENFTLLPD